MFAAAFPDGVPHHDDLDPQQHSELIQATLSELADRDLDRNRAEELLRMVDAAASAGSSEGDQPEFWWLLSDP